LENAANTKIFLDGAQIPNEVEGYWVDKAIQTIALPRLAAGHHELELRAPFTRKSNLEWCYLLGDFGVDVSRRQAKVVAPVRELAWGDWTKQGLPFYAGNVTYHCRWDGAGELALRVPSFGAALLSVETMGRIEKIAFAPFRAQLNAIGSGDRPLEITAYGNRENAFGPLHDVSGSTWIGPSAWRSTGEGWTYEYKLCAMGILEAPIIESLAQTS
jgi:hypothetical protein